MRLTRPGADQTPEGSEPNASEKDCATVDLVGTVAVWGWATSPHLTQPSCHALGCDVVDPGADAGLGAREVLQPARRPQDRHGLEVQAGDFAPLANRRLVPAGDVGHGDRRAVRPFVV